MTPSAYLKKQEEQKKKDLRYVKISNSLLECYVIKKNIIAVKIVLFLAMKSDKIKSSNDDISLLRFSLKELIETIKSDKKTVLRNLSKMQETSITFVEKDLYEENITVIPYIKIETGKDIVEIKIFSKILQLIKDVESRFTIINASNLVQLKNVNTIKMLGLIKIIDGYSKGVGKKKCYSLFELNSMFSTNYKTFYEFERKILKPVKEDIDQESKLTFFYDFNYEQGSRGRPKIKEVIIYLKNNENRQLKMF